MCKFIGNSNERILCKLSKSEILRLYSIVHVAMETTKTSNFISQSKSFISIFFTCQVSACELQPFCCHDLTNDIYSQTAKTVFTHLKQKQALVNAVSLANSLVLRFRQYMPFFSQRITLLILFRNKLRAYRCGHDNMDILEFIVVVQLTVARHFY